MRRARTMLAARSCWPSTPSPGVPGCPYSATSLRPGNSTWPPPGSWRPASATASLLASRATGPNWVPTAMTALGRCRARLAMATGSARGSGSATPITAAPAARAVMLTAVISALASLVLPAWPGAEPMAGTGTSTATRRSGTGTPAAGIPRAVLTTRTPGSPAVRTPRPAAGRPTARTAAGCSARTVVARLAALPGANSSSGACAARAAPTAACRAAPPGAATTTTGAVANSVRANRAVRSPGADAASTETGDDGMRVRTAGHRSVPLPLTALLPIVPAAWPTMAHTARTLTTAVASSNSRRQRMPAGLPASRPSAQHLAGQAVPGALTRCARCRDIPAFRAHPAAGQAAGATRR
jgi:hypothetical protein